MRAAVVLAVLAPLLAACRPTSSSPVGEARADDTPAARPAADGVAVVELFTSEGCSSCPPADDVLGALAREHSGGRHVLALAFHVDYWDELGWPDRFASPGFTARQRTYARAFGARGMYTPQMVVGGTVELTGSDRDRADAAIAASLSAPAPVHIVLRTRRTAGGDVAVDWTATGAGDSEVLQLAAVETSATTDVRAGENAGRTLHHTNVVRAFETVAIDAGTATLAVPATLRGKAGIIVAYAQRIGGSARGMPVVGAAQAPMPE